MQKSDADIKILLSDRNPGKSFAVKSLAMADALADRGPFIYLRRQELESKTGQAAGYLSDWPLTKYAGGWDGIVDQRGEIFLGNVDPKGIRKTLVPDKRVGFVCDLFSERYYKSNAVFSTAGTRNIIYEEFITDGLYLKDEPAKLESFLSTVKRDNQVTLWLIGNTMSRICPYFTHWNLRNIPKQQPGTIERYVHTVNVGDGSKYELKIDVQIIPDLEGMGFGWFSKKKVKNSVWVTGSYPHLPKKVQAYDVIHTLYITSGQMYTYRLQLLSDPETGVITWYVEPFTKNLRPDARIIGTSFDVIQNYPFGTVGIRPLVPEERTAIELLKAGHWCSCDNLTGDDFNNLMINLSRLK